MILVLMGASGVGKTTVCELLRAERPDLAIIEVDTLWAMTAADPWGRKELRRAAVRSAVTMVNELSTQGRSCVFVTGPLWDEESVLRSDLAPYEKVCLLADRIALSERLRRRGYGNQARALELNRYLTASTGYKIDTTRLTPREVMNRVLLRLM